MDATLAGSLEREHRELDRLFGEFLGALGAADPDLAARAIAEFDARLRRHTADEEARLYPPLDTKRLAAVAGEGDSARRARELLLEHVQVRELSGMILRILTEQRDLDGARRLAGNLARRWDAHTTREEREIFGAKS